MTQIKLERASLYKYQGEYVPALNLMLSVIDDLQNTNHQKLLLRANIDLAEYYRKTGKYEKASETLSLRV